MDYFRDKENLKVRIERLSVPEPMSGCWLWIGSVKINPAGIQYGRFTIGTRIVRRTFAAHRAAYEIFRGPVPDGLNVCHSCDVGLCINPDHLFVGTQQDNMHDAIKKGRMQNAGRGPKSGNGGMMSDRYGEDWPGAKLSNSDVIDIRRSTEKSSIIAQQFDISDSYVRQIKLGQRRKVR